MRRSSGRRPGRGAGFTLLELLLVIVIISILLALILTAALGGVRRAEERATQSLIAKLESGMTDRVEALISTRADANYAHQYLSTLWLSNTTYIPQRTGALLPTGLARAQVIAQFDRLRAELPDVFLPNLSGGSIDANYPINFAANPYPGSQAWGPLGGYCNFLLPMGVGIVNDPNAILGTTSYGSNPPVPLTIFNSVNFPESTGIFGATYTAAGGLYKQLKATPNGYDGTDNNNNGLIDEVSEGGLSTTSGTLQTFLTNHTHKTARSEMLYAILVEGVGPLGSVFNPDDFTDREVQDTDHDGLLEFVDAWGEPLQFYRWPVFFQDDVQRGPGPYQSPTAPRDQDPLDPNQQLVAPAWWSSSFNQYGPYTGSGPVSGGATLFQTFFHTLVDPHSNPAMSGQPVAGLWDRGQIFYQRRAYYSRFLIVSGGPDKLAGIARLDKDYYQNLADFAPSAYYTAVQSAGFNLPTGNRASDVAYLLIENQGAALTPSRTGDAYQTPLSWTTAAPNVHTAIESAMQNVGADDITNHNLLSPGGVIQ